MRFFAWPNFCLTVLTFRPQKREKCSALRALSALRAFQLFQLKLFWRLTLMVWRAVLRGWDTPPPCWPPTPTIASTPHRAVAPPPNSVLPPSSPGAPLPPPPPVASCGRSQPLAGRLRAIRPTLVGYVFFIVLIWFYWNSLTVCSWSSFCLVKENSLNCTSGIVLLCFLFAFLLDDVFRFT